MGMSIHRINDLSVEQIRRWLTLYPSQVAYITLTNRSERDSEVPLGRLTIVDTGEPDEADPFDEQEEQQQEQAAPENASVEVQAERIWEWVNDLVRGELDADAPLVRFRLRFYAVKGSKCLLSPAFSAERLLSSREKPDSDVFAPDNPAVLNVERSALALLLQGTQQLLDMNAQMQANHMANTERLQQAGQRQLEQLSRELIRTREVNEQLISALTGARLRRAEPSKPASPDGEAPEKNDAVVLAAIDQIGKAVELLAVGRSVSPEERGALEKLTKNPRLRDMLSRKDLGQLLENDDAVEFLGKQLDFLAGQAETSAEPAPDPTPDDPPPFE